jgi:hypothetical protein
MRCEVSHHLPFTLFMGFLQLLSVHPIGRAIYTGFCHDVHDKIALPPLREHPRLRHPLEDIRTLA